MHWLIRLRQNTLQLAAGMNGGANAPKLEQRRRVGFCEFRFDTPQLAAGRFIRISFLVDCQQTEVWSEFFGEKAVPSNGFPFGQQPVKI